ncbi:MAG: histidine triad nucleotide-binding protein [Actinobacteria bacterium]|nr:histidine triad nucleotide-binding protein [Actinomycetota bacterium]
MENCLFCRIVKKEIKSEIVFENGKVLVFKDINPQAPIHLLLIPKKHVKSIVDIDKLECDEVFELLETISIIAKEFNLEKSGFRVVSNTGSSAGQSVDHLHFHIMGKRNFNWPPG